MNDTAQEDMEWLCVAVLAVVGQLAHEPRLQVFAAGLLVGRWLRDLQLAHRPRS